MSRPYLPGRSFLGAMIDGLGVSLRDRFGPGCCEPSPQAVLAIRRPSLTHAAVAAVISGVRLPLELIRIPTHAFPVAFCESHWVDPAPLIPTVGRG